MGTESLEPKQINLELFGLLSGVEPAIHTISETRTPPESLTALVDPNPRTARLHRQSAPVYLHVEGTQPSSLILHERRSLLDRD